MSKIMYNEKISETEYYNQIIGSFLSQGTNFEALNVEIQSWGDITHSGFINYLTYLKEKGLISPMEFLAINKAVFNIITRRKA